MCLSTTEKKAFGFFANHIIYINFFKAAIKKAAVEKKYHSGEFRHKKILFTDGYGERLLIMTRGIRDEKSRKGPRLNSTWPPLQEAAREISRIASFSYTA